MKKKTILTLGLSATIICFWMMILGNNIDIRLILTTLLISFSIIISMCVTPNKILEEKIFD